MANLNAIKFDMQAGKRLEQWREARGLTQRQAAKGAGISQNAWQMIESGNYTRIGLRVAQHVIAYTDGIVSFEDLGVKASRLPRPFIASLPNAHRLAG